jgi:hypothetical protein
MTNYLVTEEASIKAQAQAAAELVRSKRRHPADSARSLINILESAGRPIPLALRTIPREALQADDQQLASLEATVNRVIHQETVPGISGPLSVVKILH